LLKEVILIPNSGLFYFVGEPLVKKPQDEASQTVFFSLLERIVLEKPRERSGSTSPERSAMFDRLKRDLLSSDFDTAIIRAYKVMITPGLTACLATQEFETYTSFAEYLGEDFLDIMPCPDQLTLITKYQGYDTQTHANSAGDEIKAQVTYWETVSEEYKVFLTSVWDKYWEVYGAVRQAVDTRKRREEIRAVPGDRHEAA
jgi:hypothetical protein